MRVLVIGLGSMGKRRIRLMQQYDPALDIVGVDADTERANEVAAQFSITVFPSLEGALTAARPEAAFVCTSPLAHRPIIRSLIEQSVHVFSELDLVDDGYPDYMAVQNVKLFLSSTFLYRRDIRWMIEQVERKRTNYLYHTGQYLPDWHPWEDYRRFFVGDKRTNGCREMLAIELPWLVRCFGPIRHVTVLRDKLSTLELDHPDNLMLQIQHENGSKGQVTVDVVARRPIRRMEIYNEMLQIDWDGTPDTLRQWDIAEKTMRDIPTYDSVVNDARYCKSIIENAYMDEIDAFFTWLKGDSGKVCYSYAEHQRILSLIDEIEGISIK